MHGIEYTQLNTHGGIWMIEYAWLHNVKIPRASMLSYFSTWLGKHEQAASSMSKIDSLSSADSYVEQPFTLYFGDCKLRCIGSYHTHAGSGFGHCTFDGEPWP